MRGEDCLLGPAKSSLWCLPLQENNFLDKNIRWDFAPWGVATFQTWTGRVASFLAVAGLVGAVPAASAPATVVPVVLPMLATEDGDAPPPHAVSSTLRPARVRARGPVTDHRRRKRGGGDKGCSLTTHVVLRPG
jgi:hypothetical protein